MLSLNAGFDYVKRCCYDAGHSSCCCCGHDFQGESNVVGTHVLFCPAALFFVKGKLKCGEGQVAPKRSFVAVEEGAVAFCSGDCARSVNGGAVVVAGVEVRVVMPALQLKAGFEDF